MAEDRKFRFDPELGQFINRVSGEAIPHDEPVLLFRARDVHALPVLLYYATLAQDAFHLQVIQERIDEFEDFRNMFPDRMKEPGITRHYNLHSSRRHPFLEDENRQESRRHERSQDQRLEALEHRDDNLDKEMKQAMADIDELNSILGGIVSDASTLGDDFKNLEAQLQAAQTAAANNQPIDLTNAILTARSAQSALDAIVQSAAAVGVSPAPAPAPSGGDTSGASGGDTSGAAGGDTSGASGGDTSEAGGDPTGGVSGGDTSGATGDASGATGGDTSGALGDASGGTGGDTSGAASGDGTSGASGGDTSGAGDGTSV